VVLGIAGPVDEPAEAMPVDLIQVDTQQVSAVGAVQPGLAGRAGGVSQDPPEPHDVGVQGVAGLDRWRLAPDPVHQRLGTHQPARIDQQCCQNRTLLGRSQRWRRTSHPQLNWAEDPKLRRHDSPYGLVTPDRSPRIVAKRCEAPPQC
jgi:hypothetical protein